MDNRVGLAGVRIQIVRFWARRYRYWAAAVRHVTNPALGAIDRLGYCRRGLGRTDYGGYVAAGERRNNRDLADRECSSVIIGGGCSVPAASSGMGGLRGLEMDGVTSQASATRLSVTISLGGIGPRRRPYRVACREASNSGRRATSGRPGADGAGLAAGLHAEQEPGEAEPPDQCLIQAEGRSEGYDDQRGVLPGE